MFKSLFKPLRRLAKSYLKKTEWGRKKLLFLEAERNLFLPCLTLPLGGRDPIENADLTYRPPFTQIFILLSAYISNGLRGDILEFGVYNGFSSRLLANLMRQFSLKESRLHLFDSFEGLPEEGDGDHTSYEAVNKIWTQGAMKTPSALATLLEQKLSEVLGPQKVFVVKGFFQDTLEKYLKEASIKKALLIHLDCDLYSSSKYVLKTLIESEILQDGTLLLCDDWMCSFGNANFGQRKALREIEEEYPRWSFEKYLNYGLSQAFVVHDNSVTAGKVLK